PLARVEMSGQTNLVEQSYDQIVTVSPHVSSPLPIAGALTGGVAGGVVAWVVEQLLRTGLKQVINFQYHITGSWKEPKITKQ
ncbi:MAG TPA: hypothetical protein ENI48_06720, partial [Thioploca sp.]|nr:hypothetical protein [Thioploca sp.]